MTREDAIKKHAQSMLFNREIGTGPANLSVQIKKSLQDEFQIDFDSNGNYPVWVAPNFSFVEIIMPYGEPLLTGQSLKKMIEERLAN